MIFDINKYAINDGPGIRLTIFLKGCPLACQWCHNPESRDSGVQKLYNKDKCISCGECVYVCPNKACSLTSKGIVTYTDLCNLCGKCADVCPTKAIEMSGRMESIEDLVEIIEREKVFFEESCGGVTISGGEPLMHADFLIELLDKLGEMNIHRAVDTCGHVPASVLMEVARRTDLFLYDLKMMDSEKHKAYTGVDNQLILNNLQLLATSGAEINIRIPLIGGVNTDPDNIEQSAAFIASLAGKKKRVNLLPYHNIACKKYEKLGLEYDGSDFEEPSAQKLREIVEIFAKYDIDAIAGG